MANKKELLPFCRYYKGEKENPYKEGNEALFWDYEKKWIELTFEAYQGNDSPILGTYINEYVSAGLGQFDMTDTAPATLKALLFNRYLHFTSYSIKEGAEPFKKFYNEQYKKSPQ